MTSGEQPWSVRRLRVAEQLLHEGVVLVGFQEALVRQVRDLAELLGPEWDWVRTRLAMLEDETRC